MNTIFADPDLNASFRSDGYVVVPLLTAGEIRSLAELHQDTTPEVPRDYYATPFSKEAKYRETIRQGVNAVLQPRLISLLPHFYPCLSSYVAKRGKSKQGRVPLHQDFSTVDAEKHTSLHVWCPLIDVDETNGCLRAVAGSHAFFNHISSFTRNPAPYDSLRRDLEERCSTCVPMKAGSAFIFDERLLHWSDENQTDDLRIAVGSILIPEGVTPLLYMWDKERPNELSVLEVSVDFLTRLEVGAVIAEPYPEGVKYLKSIPHPVTMLSAGDIAPLQTTTLPTSEQPGNGSPRAGHNGQSGLVSQQKASERPDSLLPSGKGWFDRLKAWLRR